MWLGRIVEKGKSEDYPGLYFYNPFYTVFHSIVLNTEMVADSAQDQTEEVQTEVRLL
jgi:hypothetical protein